MFLNAVENTTRNLMSRNVSVFDKQQDMRKSEMRFKHPAGDTTRTTQKRSHGLTNTKKPTQKIMHQNSMPKLESEGLREKMHCQDGLIKRQLHGFMSSRKKRREKQESSTLLTTSFHSKENLFVACMLKRTCKYSRRVRICGSSTSLVDEIVPYSVETRRRRIKSRCIKTLDMEYAFLNHQGSSAGSASTARSTASVESWLTTPTGASMVGNSTDIGTGGGYTTPGWTSGGSILAPTDSSNNGTLVVANLKAVIAACWSAGGNPGILLCAAGVKQTVSGFAGIATIYREAGTTAKGTAIVGAADLYISDFGEHRVVPDRFCKTNQLLVLDMDYWSVGYLRPVRQIPIARTGASEKRFIDVEFCLIAQNPQSSGKISSVVP